MFRGGQANPYDDIVAKTTDENLTSENWELILNLCDKVQDEGEQGARNVIAALLKRLAHRNPNVQLYTLSLCESLTKNCGIQLHREIASRAFTQGLERIIQDRNAHDKVKRRALSLIAMWTVEFEKDPTLGIMEECYNNLKSKGLKFEAPQEAPPPDVDDEVRRREEEELQRVLEMSMQDKGGRGPWSEYSLAAKNAAGSGSSSAYPGPSSAAPKSQPQPQTQQPTYGGYVPAANPTVSAAPDPTPSPQIPSAVSYTAPSPAPSNRSSTTDSTQVVTRVRALHTFEPTEAGELGFEKGDIIKVVDRGYKDWWRGQLKGRTGIFPVNYVEPLPEPTSAELAKEAEQEAAVFGQAANVDRLLTMLRQMDPAKDNLADDEEIQELYRSCMSLRPKIVKLIDKYTQKRADLVSMNESFVKARTIFDRMMEESLARHSTFYDGRPPYGAPVQPYQGRPESRARQDYAQAPQAFGWNPNVYDQPGYNAYPAPQAAYGGPPAPGPESSYPGAPQPYGVPEPYPPQHAQPAYGQQPPYGATPAQPQPGPGPSPYHTPGLHEPQGYPGIQIPPQAQQPQSVSPPVATPQPFGGYGGVPGQPQFDAQAQHIPQQQQQPQHQATLPTHPQVQPQVQPQIQPQTQPQVQPQQQPVQTQPLQPVVAQVQPQPQPQAQPQVQAQPQTQPQTQPQVQTASPVQEHQQPAQQQQQSGPPFVFDPNGTYEDANVQAWAQYYAHGGTDPTGSVYFISVPGVKEAPKPTPSRSASQDTAITVQPQTAQHAQGYPDPAAAASVAPLNVQHHDTTQPAASAPVGQQPSSPSQQHAFYQPQAGAPASPVQQHQAYGTSPYGSSPYPTQPGAPVAGVPPAGADQQAWQGQYYNMPNQFANMNVGDGQQGPGPQVGTPA